MKFTLGDDVLAAIARSVQVGMLSGTDIVDHLRQLQLELKEGETVATLSEECVERMERNVNDMLDRAKELSSSHAALSSDEN